MSAHLDRGQLTDPEHALSREWLLTDGVGGFASSTPWQRPMRRYHGLLIAHPPGLARRHLFVARFDATVVLPDGSSASLASLQFAGGRKAASGERLLESFALAPHPTWTWRLGDVILIEETRMPKGSAAVICRYSARGGALRLRLRPALACREADGLHFRNDALDPTVARLADGVRVQPYAALPPVTLRVAGAPWSFAEESQWLMGIEYPTELDRGYDGVEDQWCPGTFDLELADGTSVELAASVGPERAWADDAAAPRSGRSPLEHRLGQTAGDFLYLAPGDRLGICAGYPWFLEWGRDTFLSLPGLTLARGRLDQATAILTGALPFLRDGLLPNIYGETVATSHYGSVDAALWFARAVDLWRAAGGDRRRFDRELAPALLRIATAYHDGTHLGIRARDDGLLQAGSPDLNATWMDAQTPAGPVTPRDGMPVEIEALWLALLDQCAEIEGPSIWAGRRDRAFRRFTEAFWLPAERILADRVRPDGTPDPRVRPNMVLAAALRRSPLTAAMQRGVLERTERDLLTPRGLRTLAPDDPDYVGVYQGGQIERDHAYHQGTVWPWLLGGYVELALRVRGRSDAARLRTLLDGFAAELDRAGLEHISEVFDGDPPHRPGGSIAQAWSTAELLRAHRMLDAGVS